MKISLSEHYLFYAIGKFGGSINRQYKVVISTRKLKKSNKDNFLLDLSQIDRGSIVSLSSDINEATIIGKVYSQWLLKSIPY